MQVSEAFVSGSLGQAVYRREDALFVLDAPQAEPREALPNEIQLFRRSAREVVAAHPEGLPVSVEKVRAVLDEEVRFFDGLDSLLVGMDRDFSVSVRKRAIRRADVTLSADTAMGERIRMRFLVPANSQEWDPVGAHALATEIRADAAGVCYRMLAEGVIDRLADDIAVSVLEKLGSGIDAAKKSTAILRSGLLKELAWIEASQDRSALSKIIFRRNEFPKLRDADPSGQILVSVVKRIKDRLPPLSESLPIEIDAVVAEGGHSHESPHSQNAILAAVERAIASHGQRKGQRRKGSADDVPDIRREIDWIGKRLALGDVVRAEQALVKLINRQSARSRAEDIVKTLTAVADLARRAKLLEWMWHPLGAIEILGKPDATAMNVRAEALRDLSRYDEALAAFEETMRRFPQDEVTPNARAETLRDLGRYDEALAAFEETMRRFPQNEVAPTARAETLRDLGRYDEALAAFEETIRRFPQNTVASNARAETLRDLGRYDEALAAFEETMRRFPQDEVAPTARAETLRDLGRYDEALAVFEETMRRFPQDAVAPTARAETLRDLGRYDEALAAFEETMRRFPQDAVAPNARAETLRDLGHYDEALAAFEETMRRFPQDAVAPNARAETLRDLGRYDEALAAFEETMRRFPQDAVAPNARAETLRDLGRYDEALAAFEETMRRFPQDAVAPNARGETRRDLGRYDEALAAFEETMRRFPQDAVAPNARAETLRDLGRYDEALAAFEETMRRFPQDAVAPTARAETLRDLGRYDEALAAFEETMRRRPQNNVVRSAYAHLLAALGRIGEVEILLAPFVARRQNREDWIATHILAMGRLRVGRAEEALVDLESGVRNCKFPDVRRYFETARPLAFLANQYPEKAARELEVLAGNKMLSRDDMTNIVLFRAHALAEAGETQRAQALFEGAQIIDFPAARQKRLASALTERYGLASGVPAPAARARELNENIATLEFELVRPKLWSFRARVDRAA